MTGRSPPRYLWPDDHQRTGEPFSDPPRPVVRPYEPEKVGPHEHTEPLCSLCETYLRMEKLRAAEEKFLLACAWTKKGDDAWEEPVETEDHDELRTLTFGHAVNSEKLHGIQRETCSAEDLGALVHAETEYILSAGWGVADPEIHRNNAWEEPAGRHERRRIYHGLRKAVNSQKQWDQLTLRLKIKEKA